MCIRDRTDPVRNSLPDFAVDSIVEAMPHLGRKLCGFDAPEAVMKAVETRSSSPVRILRDESGQSSICLLYTSICRKVDHSGRMKVCGWFRITIFSRRSQILSAQKIIKDNNR